MNFKDYSKEVLPSWVADRETQNDRTKRHALFGLVGETGELFELIKKRDFRGQHISERSLLLEFGDVFCYLMFILYEYQIDIAALMPQEVLEFQLQATQDYIEWDQVEALTWFFQGLGRMPWGQINIGGDPKPSLIQRWAFDLLKPLAHAAALEGFTLEEVFQANIRKIHARRGLKYEYAT